MFCKSSIRNCFLIFTIFCFLGGVNAQSAEASVKRGKISLNGRYSVRANGCQLKFGANSTTAVTRIKCTGTGKAQTGVNSKGVTFLRLKDSIVLTGKSCFFAKIRESKRRVDLRCQATDPDATPTPTPTPTVTPTPNMNFITDAGGSLGVVNYLGYGNTDAPQGLRIASCSNGISGLLNEADSIVGVDRRPQNGMLYAIGYKFAGTLQLFTISTDTCVATKVGSTGTFVGSDGSTPVQIGTGSTTIFDMDFNPTSDRIRVVTSNGQNFRMNPNTGAFVDGDLGGSSGSVTGLNMDGDIQSGTTSVEGAAYTNNKSNSTVTTLYTLDHFSDKICRQSPPNNGIQVCSSLGTPVDSISGFDIAPGVDTTANDVAVSSGFGYSFVKAVGGTEHQIAKIDLAAGTLTATTSNLSNAFQVKSFAIMQPDGVAMVALTSDGSNLVRFNSKTPGTTTTVATSGVTAGETLVGLDFSPSTGQLYSIGINATNDTGTLYRLDPQSGAATVVGSAGNIAMLDTSAVTIDLPAVSVGYGLNVNPTADRIRVVTGSGLNFRINPTTGAVVDSDTGSPGTQPDTNLNGATSSIHGCAYTNSSAGNTVTSLYTLSATTNSLYLQISPNSGVQSAPVPLTLNGSALDIDAVNGFNIPADVRVATSDSSVTTGDAYGVFTVGGTTGLYSINLATGAVTSLGSVGAGSTAISGLAVANRTAE